MGDKTDIEWTDASWNPATGCTKVSPGCDNCYAEAFAERFRGTPGNYFAKGFDIVLRRDKLDQPIRWRKPRRIFVNSMSDLFHKDIPTSYIAEVFAVMAQAPQHTFQLLTKRHGRMQALLRDGGAALIAAAPDEQTAQILYDAPWPLPNLWLVVSVENQEWANVRIPVLLRTPAAVRGVSMEPLLSAVTLTDVHAGAWKHLDALTGRVRARGGQPLPDDLQTWPHLDWVIVGGESGPGARPMHGDWARIIRNQCVTAGVAFLFKQWGQYRATPVVEDSTYAGGGYFVNAYGSRTSVTVRESGMRKGFVPALRQRMQPGDERNDRVIMLDEHTVAVWYRSKKGAGRELDGRTWDEYPQPVTV